MGQSSTEGTTSSINHPTAAVYGGASAHPTAANNVGGGAGWGDRSPHKGGRDGHGQINEGLGHITAHNARSTAGEFLGLQDQKTRAENKFLSRADLAAANVKPMTESGEPTCASEDHTFMGHWPGGSNTLPGWDTVKNVFDG
ncbi:FAD dependent oxidoreductase [Penicillium alfredii]|uniref:FAD dependent oxidoreductase n=1 Tax=Penicillium alfredii TaxID=1506179 RepID=A0A9W9FSS0_9EURO|nr:FAD dependent oxidoreductase [Penicillium alfredii]KAJ5105744.1 FAD dependent oxidoreductase [Penicillium alfredii]